MVILRLFSSLEKTNTYLVMFNLNNHVLRPALINNRRYAL